MSDNGKKVPPMILIILDGWGIAPPSKGNAITLAKTSFIGALSEKFPFTKLCASGRSVGLPPHQSGNSEAGHMNIGAGRVAEQDAVVISKSINQGTFFKNPAFIEAIDHAKKNKSNLHLMGMLSNGMSAHSDPDHIVALLTMIRIKRVKDVYLHLFTDGRDSPKYASLKLVSKIESCCKNGEKIATVMGRFYAMDRKKKWARTKKAYDALVLGHGRRSENAIDAITEGYNRKEDDEFLSPYVIIKKSAPLPRISDNDSVIFFNLRSDRARQLTKMFIQDEFNKLNPGSPKRSKVLKNLKFVAMTDFGPDLGSIITAYPSVDIRGTLPMCLGGLRQLYIAETEKYAHVTYFFNGGYSRKLDAEDYFMVDSPDVRSYDETPAMSSEKLADRVIENVKSGRYDFTVLNLAAPDMIGHTGNLKAGIECCGEVDKQVKRIVEAYWKSGGAAVITADHGNIEEMVNLKTGEIDTEHSTNPVPFILAGDKFTKLKLKKEGALGDIAPTILELMKEGKPKEMSGETLIK